MAAVIQEAYVHGVSTRKVDEIVRALGTTGISAQSVSRLCAELDASVAAFLSRPLERHYPYLWLDATYLRVRADGRVLSQACVIAIGVTETGEREILGCELGPSEEAAFWSAFLRALVERGLAGVELVVSDAHGGLRGAIEQVLSGAAWQRCRVHFMRNLLALVPRHAGQVVAAAVRTIFAQPDKASAHEQLGRVAEGLQARFPRAAELLLEAEEEILAHMAFPPEHRAKLHSTNPLERVNGEIKRRTRVVGIFPGRTSALRLVGAILMEQQDEWAVGRRYLSAESMAKLRGWKEGERPAELLVAVA